MRRAILLAPLVVLSLVSCTASSERPHGTAATGDPSDAPGANLRTSGIFWPEDQALPSFAEARHLEVANVDSAPGDVQLLFATLEGLVNRDRPRIFLIQDGFENERGTWWLGKLEVPFTVHPRPWSILEMFVFEIRGTIVYDPAVRASINVATTMAGLSDAVVASSALAERLRTRYGLEVIGDLRGRFVDDAHAYRWQYEHLWPRATHRMLIGVRSLIQGAPFGGIRDYAVANRAMVVWLDPTDPVERDLLERILADVEPNTPYLGWFPAYGEGEIAGVELLSTHGVYTLGADTFQNMTVFSSPCCRDVGAPPSRPPAPPLADKIYVTFTLSEGDNLQYDQIRMREAWDDPQRGRVPMNWTIAPLLWDAAPAILRYYLRTATSNDLLMAGPSGAGYASPTPWPDDSFGRFTEMSARYMRRSGLETIWIADWVGGDFGRMSAAEAQRYIDDVRPAGIMLQAWWPSTENTLVNGSLPQSILSVVGGVRWALRVIRDATAGWAGTSPMFLSVGINTWEMSPADVVRIADSLGPEFVVVRADQYFELIRQEHAG